MNPEEIIRALQALTALSQTLTPVIRAAMETLSSQDQDKIRQAASQLAEQNDTVHKQVTDRLRG